MSNVINPMDWQSLGKHRYRSTVLYEEMFWDEDMSIDAMIIAVGGYGGPIAMVRDKASTKMMRVRAAGSGHDNIRIFSAAGKELACMESRLAEARVVLLAWSAVEELWVVYDNGMVDIYSVLGRQKDSGFGLLPKLTEDRVVHAALGETGFAALVRTGAGAWQVWVAVDVQHPEPEEVKDTGLGVSPKCMALVEGTNTRSGDPEVLLATADNSIVVVASEGGLYAGEDQALAEAGMLDEAVLMMATSPNGSMVACFSESGQLLVLRTNFREQLLAFDTHCEEVGPPAQLLWCGDSAVALGWPGKGVLVVGSSGHFLKYPFAQPFWLVQEIDCVRVITDTQHHLIQRVPEHTEGIGRYGSSAPAALLVEAIDEFDREDARADDMLLHLSSKKLLVDAVYDCLLAAADEWSDDAQRALLRAAAAGKAYEPDAEFEGIDETETIHVAFVDVCKKLRVLNALRDFSVGMSMTSEQYDVLTAEVIVDRLVNRHRHQMAIRVCKYLGMDHDHVLVHWACAKVRASPSVPDAELRDLVRAKLRDVKGVSYADIAATADSVGRTDLATMFLDFEPRAADQVPLLLRMGASKVALAKAIDSGDSDLINLALLHMKRTMTGDGRDEEETAFFRAIKPYPEAVNLLIVYCRARDPAMLKRLYQAYGRYQDYGTVYAREAYAAASLPDRHEKLGYCEQVFAAGAQRKGYAHLKLQEAVVSEQMKLLVVQDALEAGGRLGVDLVDGSLSDTLYDLTVLGETKKADSLRKDFQVSDARFWYAKIRAYARAGDWESMYALARSKKQPPLPLAAFAEAAEREHRLGEVTRYAAMMATPEDRVDWFIRAKQWRDALSQCAAIKDDESRGERLAKIHGECGDPALQREAQAMATG